MPRTEPLSGQGLCLVDMKQAADAVLSFLDNTAGLEPTLIGLDVDEQLGVFDPKPPKASDNRGMTPGKPIVWLC